MTQSGHGIPSTSQRTLIHQGRTLPGFNVECVCIRSTDRELINQEQTVPGLMLCVCLYPQSWVYVYDYTIPLVGVRM